MRRIQESQQSLSYNSDCIIPFIAQDWYNICPYLLGIINYGAFHPKHPLFQFIGQYVFPLLHFVDQYLLEGVLDKHAKAAGLVRIQG